MFRGNVRKPIIGIIGGIGSGKSFVAQLFGELGAMVINSDELVHAVYARDDVKSTLREWWGDGVFREDGSVDRRAIAKRVFTDVEQRRELERLVHPLVNRERERLMESAKDDGSVTAYVWDTPLLVETGLHRLCDAVVFVDAPVDVRLARVSGRGWDEAELVRRENSQMPLDNKRQISDYVISNAADAASARSQVRLVFSRIKPKII